MCTPLKVNRRFGGIFCLHLQGLRINQVRNQYEAGSKQSPSFAFYLLFDPEDEGDVTSKRPLIFN
jgi:hypothetical protein